MSDYIDDDIIDEIISKNDIVDVISENIKLDKGSSGNFKARCPFHNEKTPSFSVSSSKQIFKCFGCNKGGNVIEFIKLYKNLDFVEALKLLAARARVVIPENGVKNTTKAKLISELHEINLEAARFFFKNLKGSKTAQKYLKERGLEAETIKKFKLGWGGSGWDALARDLVSHGWSFEQMETSGLVVKNRNGGFSDRFRDRLIFPIHDIRGNIIAFGGRVLTNDLPKYINSPETAVYTKGLTLYAMEIAKNYCKSFIIVVEGYMDAISLYQSGIQNVVASLGTALTEEQAKLLKRYTSCVYLSYDSDKAGQAATLRAIDILQGSGNSVKVIHIPKSKDPDGFVREYGAESFSRLVEKATLAIEYKLSVSQKEQDISNDEGRLIFLTKAVQILAGTENELERDIFIKKIASEYNISEGSIRREIEKSLEKTALKQNYSLSVSAKKEIIKEAQTDLNEKQQKIEAMIITMICNNNTLFPYVSDRIKKDNFGKHISKMAEYVYDNLEKGKEVKPSGLFTVLEGEMQNYMSKIFFEEPVYFDSKQEMEALLSLVNKLFQNKADEERQRITELLNDENINDEEKDKLRKQYRDLHLTIEKLKPGYKQ